MEQLRIDTPEQVALEFPIAGVGSRFLAIAVDTVLQAVMALAILLAAAGTFRIGRLVPARLAAFAPALVVIGLFVLQWGYFAAFEIFWRGQTPGKRVAHIRVIQATGRPASAMAIMLRNLLRGVDALPGIYLVGIITMMISRHSRRLGDLAAGTIVVHEHAATLPYVDWRTAPTGSMEPSSGPATRLTPEEIVLIETYLARRFDLDPWVQDRAGDQIADRITARTGVTIPAGRHRDDFLEEIARNARNAQQFG